jgi:hypothetical protein
LTPFLAQYGFIYAGSHFRAPGVAVEYTKGASYLFAACEGDVLSVDLILQRADAEYYRVSLNQALWFNNIRTLVKKKTCTAQLEVFLREAADCCEQLLIEEHPLMDDRYCYPLPNGPQSYLKSQRGT